MKISNFYCICSQTTSHMAKISIDVMVPFLGRFRLRKIFTTYTELENFCPLLWATLMITVVNSPYIKKNDRLRIYFKLAHSKCVNYDYSRLHPFDLILFWLLLLFYYVEGLFWFAFFLLRYGFVNKEIYIHISVYIMFVAWFIV